MRKTRKIVSFLLAVLIFVSTFMVNSSVVFAASVKTPKLTKITSKTTSVTIKWKKQSNISGYAIYQRKGNNKFKRVATVSKKATSYTKGSLTSATKYTYYIKSYTKSKKGKYTYSTKSNSLNIYTKPAKPNISSITSPTSTSIKLKWSKVSRINGYVLYRKSGSKYIKVADISAKSTSYTVKKLKESKKYYYAIRAYKVVNGKRVYGSYSAIASIKTKHTHKYVKKVIKPTCAKSGYTKYTCQKCNYSYKSKKTSATGHKNIKTDIIAATCGTNGSKKEVCGVCNTTIKTTTIPATGKHNYVAKTCAEAYKEVVNTGESVTTQNLASYQHKTDWMCNICSDCHQIKQGNEGDIWSKYSNKEACEIMLGYVNNLRKEYKAANPGFYHATDKVTLVYDEKLTELANIRAKELSTSYSHDTGTRTGAYECISYGRNTVNQSFEGWKASTGHHDIMIHKKGAKLGYGRYVDSNGIVYNCLLIWDAGWSAELWEMKYG